jgi:predicted dehydrogenase
MTVSKSELRIGIVGAGAFASFAARAFLQAPGIKVVAVGDTNHAAATHLAGALSAKAYSDYESFLCDRNISLVYISTPPFLHYAQAKAALLARKNAGRISARVF